MLGKVTPKLSLGWGGNGVLDSIDAPSPLTCGPSKILWFGALHVLGKGYCPLLPSAGTTAERHRVVSIGTVCLIELKDKGAAH